MPAHSAERELLNERDQLEHYRFLQLVGEFGAPSGTV